MAKQTYVDRQYRSFQEDVADALVGKEGYVVEQVAGKSTIQLYNAGIPIGVLMNRLEGSQSFNVRLIGGGGTLRASAGGAINAPAYVKAAAGGQVVAANSGDKCIGIMLSPLVAAQNDVIEIADDRCIMP